MTILSYQDKSFIMTTLHVPKLWALVIAVLRSFALDKNLKNSDFLLYERNIRQVFYIDYTTYHIYCTTEVTIVKHCCEVVSLLTTPAWLQFFLADPEILCGGSDSAKLVVIYV